MFPFLLDPAFIILLPAILFAFYTQGRVKKIFKRYFNQENTAGITGAEAAERLLSYSYLDHIKVIRGEDDNANYYSPKEKSISLSPQVYDSASVTSLGIVAHEIGHAAQHEESYIPLKFRNILAPVTRIGTFLAFPLLFMGIIFSYPSMTEIGILTFMIIVIFHIVTLPVEFNASRRAIMLLETNDMLKPFEFTAVDSVLNAAALTYIAGALMAVTNLVRLMFLSGMGVNRD